LRRPDSGSGLLGARASEVLRCAVVIARGSFAYSRDDKAVIRSRRPGSALGRRRALCAAPSGGSADLAAAPGGAGSPLVKAVAEVGVGPGGDLRAEPMA